MYIYLHIYVYISTHIHVCTYSSLNSPFNYFETSFVSTVLELSLLQYLMHPLPHWIMPTLGHLNFPPPVGLILFLLILKNLSVNSNLMPPKYIHIYICYTYNNTYIYSVHYIHMHTLYIYTETIFFLD
jgi:hypothetical protein